MGTRPPVVLIHGACSQPGHFEAWRETLAHAGHECHVPDLPGHDPSRRDILRRAGFGDYVAAVRAVVAGLDRRPVLVGHSMGALIARMVAAEGEVEGLVLLAPLPGGRIPVTGVALPYFAAVAPFVLRGQPFRPWRSAVRRLALNGLPRQEQDRIADGFVAESGRVYRDLVLGRARVRRRAIAAPMLVMHGEDDRLIPARVARGIAEKHRAAFVPATGCGHWIIAPSRIASVGKAALSWLERLGDAEAGGQLR